MAGFHLAVFNAATQNVAKQLGKEVVFLADSLLFQ